MISKTLATEKAASSAMFAQKIFWFKHSVGIYSLLVRPLLFGVSNVYRTFLFMMDPKDKFWDPLNVRISIFFLVTSKENVIFHPIFELFIC